MTTNALQWGGRFSAPPDPALLAFGSSLEDDLVLAPFDVQTSLAHVSALAGGNVIDALRATALRGALETVATEIAGGSFVAFARAIGAEDVHGAIDARVRDLLPDDGAYLHSGRSRNDQVATTLALYANARAKEIARECVALSRFLATSARRELAAGTLLCGVTHWQPAQPILLAFWLAAAAEPFVRDATRSLAGAKAALASCPLGSAAIAGTSLPLSREAACKELGFFAPSRNAMDAIGSRDPLLDAADAAAIACVNASRVAAELVIWATPAFGYVNLGDASSTGSSLMPQKRNPDVFELVRGCAHEVLGLAHGARTSLTGMPLSYHRDLQQTKRMGIAAIERGLATLRAFRGALADTSFVSEAMHAKAAQGDAVATDVADALILAGAPAREAHARVGEAVAGGEEYAALFLGFDARSSVNGKRTSGSTNPEAVGFALAQLTIDLDRLEASL